jgi:hypothetical protein
MKRGAGKKGRPRKRATAGRIRAQEAYRRALEALSLMRSGSYLSDAARAALTSPRTVKKYAGSALVREESGRYSVKASDRLSRRLRFLTSSGQIAITVRGSKVASKIATYWAAVDQYLKTGDTERLTAFRGKSVRWEREIPIHHGPANFESNS